MCVVKASIRSCVTYIVLSKLIPRINIVLELLRDEKCPYYEYDMFFFKLSRTYDAV